MSAIQIKSAQIFRLAALAQDDRIGIAKANKSLPGSRLHHIFDSHPHPYRMRLQIKGLSHGLKKCPPDTFLPRFARPPFRVPPSVLKNADTHLGIRIFWYTGRDSFAFLPGNGQKQRCHARRAGHEQQSPGLLHLNVRVPSRPEGEIRKRIPQRVSSFLFGTPEGTRTPNPRNRNPMLYPLSHRCIFEACVL